MATNLLRYGLYNSLTGQLQGWLPLRGVSFSSQLNGAGTFQATLDLSDPRIQSFNWVPATGPTFAWLVVDLNGGVVWSGPLTGRKWSVSGQGQGTRVLELDGAEGWQYWKQVLQATDYSSPPYSGITGSSTPMATWNQANLSSSGNAYAWDPMLMAAQMLQDALGVQAQNPLGGMVVQLNGFNASDKGAAYVASGTGTPSANYVGASFPYPSLQTLDAIIAGQLAQLGLNVGFDFGVDVAYASGPGSNLVGTINLSYPRRGRTVAQNNLVYDLTRARAYEFPEDGGSQASTVYGTGGNQDIVVEQNIYVINAGYLNTAKVNNHSGLNSANVTALLTSMGLGDLVLFSYPPVAPSVTIDMFDPALGLGKFITGDNAQLILPAKDQAARLFDPRFPAGMSTEWRITAWTATVGDEGDSTLQLTFDTPPATTKTAPSI